ncbi:MAG: ADP-ribosylglycohydrolase family protein [Coriobacteriales bacterium]|nr:ADP-ribosylglycohydrolase family protein [Coriobacteriales bacterium]
MDSNALKDRFEGCLLGGAAGDALGYAIEFWNEPNIFATFGETGIQSLEQAAAQLNDTVALFSDDTQMTLFTANGLTHGMKRTGEAPAAHNLWLAYQDWLGTQGDESHMPDPAHPKMWLYGESLLHALRAPGNIIGALVGKIALEQAFDLSFLESYDLIVKAADSLLA